MPPTLNSSEAPMWRVARALMYAALVWAIGNCVYVYGYLRGTRTHRAETAAFILLGALLPQIIRNIADGRPNRTAELSTRSARLLLGLSVAIVAGTYLPLLAFPPLSDDYVFFDRYSSLASTWQPWQFFRPVFGLVFWAIATAGHGSAVPFHIFSVVLHLSNALLAYVLADRYFHSRPAAVIAFAVFAANPVQIEAVLWISGLQDLLWTFFILAALFVYTSAQRLSAARVSLTAALVLAALGSKETAVCFILLFPAADYVLFRFRRGTLTSVAYALFIAELLFYLLSRRQMVPLEAGFLAAPTRYFVKQLVVMPYEVFLQPWNMSAVSIAPWMTGAIGVLVLLAVFIAVTRGRLGAAAFVGPGLIVISTLPVYSFFFVSSELQGARYLYFGAFGWAVLLATLATHLARNRHTIVFFIATLSLIDAWSLSVNLRPWRVAAAIVRDVENAHRQAAAGGPVVNAWQAALGRSLLVEGGIPREYKGVTIFRNGYPEFVKRTTQRSRGLQ